MKNGHVFRMSMRVLLRAPSGSICFDGKMPTGKLAPFPSAELPTL